MNYLIANMAVIGLAVITLGWLVQFYYAVAGHKEIKPAFILVYMLGVLLLIVDGYSNGLSKLAVMNLFSMFAAFFVLLKVSFKK
ncbi:hypothetical protein HZA42_00860 [Candidatus Peregrinibacteria bacterium]|nr:hypothetical protein [Candidatus Peregrinibacteria bacterium]